MTRRALAGRSTHSLGVVIGIAAMIELTTPVHDGTTHVIFDLFDFITPLAFVALRNPTPALHPFGKEQVHPAGARDSRYPARQK